MSRFFMVHMCIMTLLINSMFRNSGVITTNLGVLAPNSLNYSIGLLLNYQCTI